MFKLSVSLATIALGVAVVASCSDGVTSAQIDRACNVFCNKSSECIKQSGIPFPFDVGKCVTDCKDSNKKNDPDCTPTGSQVDACVSEVEKMSCTGLANPKACEDICPKKAGTTPTPDAGGGPSAADCNTLKTQCCNKVTANLKASCDGVAAAGNAAACKATYDTYKRTGLC